MSNTQYKAIARRFIEEIFVSKVAELLSQTSAFYDADMVAGLINAMLYHIKDKTVERVSPNDVRYVMDQLKATGVSLP